MRRKKTSLGLSVKGRFQFVIKDFSSEISIVYKDFHTKKNVQCVQKYRSGMNQVGIFIFEWFFKKRIARLTFV